MTPQNPSSAFFDAKYLAHLAQSASNDAFVKQHSVLADFTVGFRDTDSNVTAWIRVQEDQISAGLTDMPSAFCFEGSSASFDLLKNGTPFNRLVRQHRLTVTGNLRHCVQNWLLIYAITRLTATPEH
ncbi:MAG: hypothetical protein KA735_07190 [Burkholderiaceae bacterium]|nr:hypothetical protein [Burkholderiaceae bacterium]